MTMGKGLNSKTNRSMKKDYKARLKLLRSPLNLLLNTKQQASCMLRVIE